MDETNNDYGTRTNIDSIDKTLQNTNNDNGTHPNMDEISPNNIAVEPISFYELQQQIWRATAGDTIELDNDYIVTLKIIMPKVAGEQSVLKETQL